MQEDFSLQMMDFALKMMNSAVKLMKLALKMMDFAFKMMDFAFKMMNFALQADYGLYVSERFHTNGSAAIAHAVRGKHDGLFCQK